MEKIVEWFSDLEDKEAENTQSEQQKEKRIQKYEDSLRSFWDNFKHTNIHIIGVLDKEKEQAIENLLEKMTENFLNMTKEIDTQVQEA